MREGHNLTVHRNIINNYKRQYLISMVVKITSKNNGDFIYIYKTF